MQRVCTAIVIVLGSAIALGQKQTTPNPTGASGGSDVQCATKDIAVSKVHGIKIVSSSFDREQELGKITFTNNSEKTITAFHIQITVITAGGARERTELPNELLNGEYQVRAKKYSMPTFAGFGQLHPGEIFTKEFSLGHAYDEVGLEIPACASAVFDLVVYSDNTAETTNDQVFQQAIERRKFLASLHREIPKIGEDVYRANIQQPVAALVRSLREQDKSSFAYAIQSNFIEHSETGDDSKKLLEIIDFYKQVAAIYEEASKLKVVSQ